MHHSARLCAATPRSPHARLLIVDDEQLIRELYARVLSLEGYEVETVDDGVAALERLAEGEFDLVLTDREMPRLDGASMTLTLRSAGSRIPVIMISGLTAPLSMAVTRQFSAILPKPARHAEVVAAVGQALGRAPARRTPHFDHASTLAAA
jgi:two-component system response regulator MprA